MFNIGLDSTVSISCEVINPGTFEWNWSNNNVDMVESGGNQYEILISSDTRTSTLTVFNPMTNDTGDYTCTVTNGVVTGERTIELIDGQGKLILLYVIYLTNNYYKLTLCRFDELVCIKFCK